MNYVWKKKTLPFPSVFMGRKKQPFLLPIKAFGIFILSKNHFFTSDLFYSAKRERLPSSFFCLVKGSLDVQQKVYYLVVLCYLNLGRKKLMANNEPIVFVLTRSNYIFPLTLRFTRATKLSDMISNFCFWLEAMEMILGRIHNTLLSSLFTNEPNKLECL